MKKLLKCAIASMLAISMLAGCSSASGEVINLNGSTSMEKLSSALSETFKGSSGNVSVVAQFTGSSAGIESVINKTSDIGNSSRALKPEEIEKGIVENIVAIDGIAIITDENNTAKNLSIDELKGIYTGDIKNWNEVGGDDSQIVVIGREAGSGTRGAFESILDIKDKSKYAQEIDSTGAVVGKVQATPGSIGYVSLDVLNNSNAKILSINNVSPSIENIKSGEYTISRPFVMATNGAIEEQKESVKELFEFIYSPDGNKLIQSVGLVPTSK